MELQLQHQFFQRIFRVDFLEDLLAVQGTLKSLLQCPDREQYKGEHVAKLLREKGQDGSPENMAPELTVKTNGVSWVGNAGESFPGSGSCVSQVMETGGSVRHSGS